jgi:DNA-binding LytR/AlgR family response regulator
MTLQASLNLISISVGFIAGICFCAGAATNTSRQIANLAGSRIGYNLEIIQSFSAQRAQYLVGAILLMSSFGLQIAALMTAATTPGPFESATAVVVITALVASALAYFAIRVITKKTAASAEATIKSAIAQQREKSRL